MAANPRAVLMAGGDRSRPERARQRAGALREPQGQGCKAAEDGGAERASAAGCREDGAAEADPGM